MTSATIPSNPVRRVDPLMRRTETVKVHKVSRLTGQLLCAIGPYTWATRDGDTHIKAAPGDAADAEGAGLVRLFSGIVAVCGQH